MNCSRFVNNLWESLDREWGEDRGTEGGVREGEALPTRKKSLRSVEHTLIQLRCTFVQMAIP